MSLVFLVLPVLIPLILFMVVGNCLVILSILTYRRLRTFPNILLVSLAASDLLVGLLIAPFSLADLLYGHDWPFGAVLCTVWSTGDVLLCTASILNLVAINLDRYLAITAPITYPRNRTGNTAALFIAAAWLLSAVVCSPPLIVPQWQGQFVADNASSLLPDIDTPPPKLCGYTRSMSYRIYSAMGSFYIPLVLILFIYTKIFRVATNREKQLAKDCATSGPGGDRLRICYSGPLLLVVGTVNEGNTKKIMADTFRGVINCQKSSRSRTRVPSSGEKSVGEKSLPDTTVPKGIRGSLLRRQKYTGSESALGAGNVTGTLQVSRLAAPEGEATPQTSPRASTASFEVQQRPQRSSFRGLRGEEELSGISEDEVSTSLLPPPSLAPRLHDKLINAYSNAMKERAKRAKGCDKQRAISSLRRTVTIKGHNEGTVPVDSRIREKTQIRRERKAVTTIGLVVVGFVVCWLPFFLLYLLEPSLNLTPTPTLGLLSDVFLWLGYSNSSILIAMTLPSVALSAFLNSFLSPVSMKSLGESPDVSGLNPLVYAAANRDFRRCFKDLLRCGCVQRHNEARRRRMSVFRLHQIPAIF